MTKLNQSYTLSVFLLMGACASTAESGPVVSQPVAAPSAGDRTAARLERYYHFRHGGDVVLLMALSLDSLPLAQAERPEVDRIRTDLLQKLEPLRLAEQNLAGVLADGVAAGAFDRTRVAVAIEDVAEAATKARDVSSDPLTRLHAVLSPVERDALMDGVDSQWIAWQESSAEGNPRNPERTRMQMLSRDLGLTQDQQERIRAASPISGPDSQQMAERVRAFSNAFRGRRFDAKAFAGDTSTTAKLATWSASNMSQLIERLTPILTPDQRARLARLLRESATKRPAEAAR